MPKNIVILSDGTGQEGGKGHELEHLQIVQDARRPYRPSNRFLR